MKIKMMQYQMMAMLVDEEHRDMEVGAMVTCPVFVRSRGTFQEKAALVVVDYTTTAFFALRADNKNWEQVSEPEDIEQEYFLFDNWQKAWREGELTKKPME